jgi:hypothetical protein
MRLIAERKWIGNDKPPRNNIQKQVLTWTKNSSNPSAIEKIIILRGDNSSSNN